MVPGIEIVMGSKVEYVIITMWAMTTYHSI